MAPGNMNDKDSFLEYSAVSGVVYVTIDSQLLTHKFDEHIKLQIVFNNHEKEKEDKNQSNDIKLEENPSQGSDLFEEEDLPVNFASSDDETDACNKNQPMTLSTLSQVQDDRNCPNEKSPSKQPKGVGLVSKASIAKKRITSRLRVKAKRRSNLKRVGKENPNYGNRKKQQKDKKINVDTEMSIGNSKRKNKIDKEEDILCPYCSKSFKSKRQFRNHQRIERKEHYCEKCGRIFVSQAHLLIHMDDHAKLEATEGGMEKSHAMVDTSESKCDSKKPKKCCICGTIRSNLASLKLHVMAHTGEAEFKCCVCGHLSRTTCPHKRHLRKHLKGIEFICKICNVPFGSRGELATHQLTHTFPCNLCGNEFANKTSRNIHYRSFHKHDIIKCHLCDRLYSSQKALSLHLKHHRVSHQTQCPTCGQFFFRLKEHIEKMHSSEDSDKSPLFFCDKCPKQFKHKTDFKRHLFRVHSGEKPFECPECSKQFSCSGGLNKHMKIHLPEKPYVCEICGKACNQMGNLKIHMRTHARTNLNVLQQQNITKPYLDLEGNII